MPKMGQKVGKTMQNLTNVELFEIMKYTATLLCKPSFCGIHEDLTAYQSKARAEIRSRAEILIETIQDHDGSIIYITPEYDLFHEKDENAYEDAILHTIAEMRQESRVFQSDRIYEMIDKNVFGEHTAPIYGGIYHYVTRKEQGYPVSLTTATDNVIENAKFFAPNVEVADILHHIDILLNH